MRKLFKNLLLSKIIMNRRPQQQRMSQTSFVRPSQTYSSQQPQPQTNFKNQLSNNQSYNQNSNSKYLEQEQSDGTTKMTMAQAITLITLRLGSLETKMMNLDTSNFYSSDHSKREVNDDLLSANLSDKLEAMEMKINNLSSVDYKQQFDNLVQALIQQKNLSNTLMKENKEMKSMISNMEKKLNNMTEIVNEVKQMAHRNENKIIQLLTNGMNLYENEDMELNNEDHESSQLKGETDSEQKVILEDIDVDDDLEMTKINGI